MASARYGGLTGRLMCALPFLVLVILEDLGLDSFYAEKHLVALRNLSKRRKQEFKLMFRPDCVIFQRCEQQHTLALESLVKTTSNPALMLSVSSPINQPYSTSIDVT